MIDHISLVVSDFERSKQYYSEALAPIGYALQMDFPDERSAGFGVPGVPDFWITGNTPDVPPSHIALTATSREQVDAYYKAAIAAGGKDNGPPGVRPNYSPSYYAAFVLDPDDHNIEVVCHKPA